MATVWNETVSGVYTMSDEVSMPTVVSAPVRHDLAVVMPVYNEEACIDDVIRDWIAALPRESCD